MRKIILALSLIANIANADGITASIPNSITSVYDSSGSTLNAIKIVSGSCTLSLGSCTVNFTNNSIFTSSSTYICFANDISGVAAIASAVPQSASQIKVFGTASNNVKYMCIGS